jgi:uroporphyrinogen-III synthase
MTNSPLANLNIAVTRPQEQAKSLALCITTLGGKVILFPLLEIESASGSCLLADLVARLAEFDLAIFISPNAVKYGMAAIQSAGTMPKGLRVATVGQSSALALREAGVNDVIAPLDQSDSEALLDKTELKNVKNWKIVIFRGDGGRELLGDTLKARGAVVEYATCYRRSKPVLDLNTLLIGKPDAITISSSEALANLRDLIVDIEQSYILAVPLFVPHARIAEKAHQQGWRKVIQTPGGDDGVVSGLVAWAEATIKLGNNYERASTI